MARGGGAGAGVGSDPPDGRAGGRGVRGDRSGDSTDRPLAASGEGASGIAGADPPLHVAFGLTVRDVRAERAISQEELGYRAGLHRNYVSRIERGKVVPTLRSVERLAGALNVMPSALVSRGE